MNLRIFLKTHELFENARIPPFFSFLTTLIEVNATFEEDLKLIIEDRTMTKVASKWKHKLSKSRASSSINLNDADNDQIRYQNILDGFQMTIEHCEAFFHEYTQAEEEALVQLIYHSERLFQEKSEIRRRCQDGEFIKKLISHSRHTLCHDPTAKHVISDAGRVSHTGPQYIDHYFFILFFH